MIRNLAKKYKLVTHLERALDGFDDEWTFTYESKKGDDAWHPSSHCMPPPTELYDFAYGQLHHEGPIVSKGPGTMAKAFQVGHFWHQLLQYVVLNKLEFCEPYAIERKGYRTWAGNIEPMVERGRPHPYHWATGAGDIAPCSIPIYGDYAIDFKTMAPNQFNQQGVPDWCADKYEAQINIYMSFFDIEKALIVCIDKGSSELKEFEYVRNQPLIDWVTDKWEFVSECLDYGIRPTQADNDMFNNPPLMGPIG